LAKRRLFSSKPEPKYAGADSPVLKGAISPVNPVPDGVVRPHYAKTGEVIRNNDLAVHDEATLVKMKRAGSLASAMLKLAGKLVQPGVTTDWIDRKIHEAIVANGAYPSPMNYMGFPKSVAVAVNEVVCHGIPDDRVLEDGDVVSIDVSLYLDGVHGDNCGTWSCGEVDEAGVLLIDRSQQILMKVSVRNIRKQADAKYPLYIGPYA
jgi:methionyl aminopeptidase